MLNFTYKDKPDIEAYARDIGAEGTQILVDPDKFVSLIYEYHALLVSAETYLMSIIRSASHGHYTLPRKDDIISTLVKYCNCNEADFVQDRQQYQEYVRTHTMDAPNPYRSLSMPLIVDPLIDLLAVKLTKGNTTHYAMENAYLLLTAYKDYKSIKTLYSNIKAKYDKKLSDETYPGWTKELNAVTFNYVQRSTGRFYTNNDSIQNWPIELNKAITVEKDYFLFWCDFDQIDFRVGYHLYLREPGTEADKIYLAAEDKYRAMYEIICRAAGKTPDFDLFTKYRKNYKKAILSAMYNASEQALATDIKNYELAHELFEFFKNNNRYQTYVKSITDMISFDAGLYVTDYFGYQREIPPPNKNNPAEVQKCISVCCNTPIQSTSNSILVLWLEKLLENFEAKGFSRTKHIIPYLIRHDEVVFKVHLSVIPYLWVFKDAMQVAIDNWDILTLEPHLGVNYKVPREDFEAKFDSVGLANVANIQERIVSEPREDFYKPITEVLDVYAYTMEPLSDIAYSAYSYYADSVNLDISADPKTWTQEQCIHIISEAAKQDEHFAYISKVYGRYILYSKNKKMYKYAPSLAALTTQCNSIGVDKIHIHTTNSNLSLIQNNVMIRADSREMSKAKAIIDKAVELNFPEGWFSI